MAYSGRYLQIGVVKSGQRVILDTISLLIYRRILLESRQSTNPGGIPPKTSRTTQRDSSSACFSTTGPRSLLHLRCPSCLKITTEASKMLLKMIKFPVFDEFGSKFPPQLRIELFQFSLLWWSKSRRLQTPLWHRGTANHQETGPGHLLLKDSRG